MFPVQSTLENVTEVQFRAVCVESSVDEDWDRSFETDSEALAKEWHLSHSEGFYRYVTSARRVVPRPKKRLPRGYAWREF